MTDKSYINWDALTDQGICQRIGNFIRHHRLLQNKTQDEVSLAANISRSTLSLLERGETVAITTLIQVLRVLDLLHVMEAFSIEEEVSPIALAKMEQDKRQRARGKKEDDTTKSTW